MKVKSMDHVYQCAPPFRNNRTLPPEEKIMIGLKAVSQSEMEDYQEKVRQLKASAEEGADIFPDVEDLSRDLVRDHFVSLSGLEIEEVGDVTDFETFVAEAPRELVAWVALAVMNTDMLIEAEKAGQRGCSDWERAAVRLYEFLRPFQARKADNEGVKP